MRHGVIHSWGHSSFVGGLKPSWPIADYRPDYPNGALEQTVQCYGTFFGTKCISSIRLLVGIHTTQELAVK